MKLVTPANIVALLATSASAENDARPFQKLRIPEALTGTSFELNVHKSSRSFWKGATTDTYAYNNESFWGPSLILKQGDTVKLNVSNELVEPTTTHWHGLHLPAASDGSPLQVIPAGKTWSPSFKVTNNAATYWYHPHAHETTQKHLTMGAGGLIIKDALEAALLLPRDYGIDDIPLVLTSRRFRLDDQFSYDGDNDKYGDYAFANGTLAAEVGLPAQIVRLRILNPEIQRGYDLGFSDNRTFHVIATDGGLVSKPIPVTRMNLMVGERVEVLVDLGGDKAGSSVDLMSFNAGQAFGYPGGKPGTRPPNGGYLNNIDFRLLRINVTPRTEKTITKLPATLVTNKFCAGSEVTNQRTIRITGGRPVFDFDDKPYSWNVINQTVKLGAIEQWTIRNNNIFGHTFYIQDVQFTLISRTSGVQDYERGWKDTLYVPRGETVSFIARFADYASDTDAFMYHCHLEHSTDSQTWTSVGSVTSGGTSISFTETDATRLSGSKGIYRVKMPAITNP